jgi:hypothetical protein
VQLIADDADLRAAVSRWISLAMKSSTEPGDDEVGDLTKPGGRDTNSPRSVRRTSRLLSEMPARMHRQPLYRAVASQGRWGYLPQSVVNNGPTKQHRQVSTGHYADERTMFMRDRPTTCDDQAIAATWGRPAARWSGTLVALFI